MPSGVPKQRSSTKPHAHRLAVSPLPEGHMNSLLTFRQPIQLETPRCFTSSPFRRSVRRESLERSGVVNGGGGKSFIRKSLCCLPEDILQRERIPKSSWQSKASIARGRFGKEWQAGNGRRNRVGNEFYNLSRRTHKHWPSHNE